VNFIVIGNRGGDAGYTVIGPDGKPHHVGGWGPEALAEVAASLNIIREATHLRTPELAQAAIRSVIGFAEKELGQHLKEGGVVVLG
jgi:hypothetical protein